MAAVTQQEQPVEKTMRDILQDKLLLTKEYFIEPVKKQPKKKNSEDGDLKPDEEDDSNDEMEDKESDISDTDKESDNKTTDEIEESKQDDDIRGKIKAPEAFEKKIIGLYFSAGWCPPCREFTPLLREFYGEIRRKNLPFEIVFISFDKTAQDMKSYYMDSHGDWLAVPWDDSLKEELKTKYNITAVPKLFIIREDGDILTMKGRKEIQDKGILCFRGWQELASFRANRPRSQATVVTDPDKKVEDDNDKDKIS